MNSALSDGWRVFLARIAGLGPIVAATVAATVATAAVVWALATGSLLPTRPGGDAPPVCGGCHRYALEGPHVAVACTGCHLGDATAVTMVDAHAEMEAEPGALDTVDRTCGVCHAAAVAAVRTLPMTTGRGIVGVDRFVFGEIPTPDTEETLADVLAVATPSPGQDHLRRLCAGCHLGTRRANRDDGVTGGSGCGACHAAPVAGGHPAIDAAVADTRCQGCHGRSARISLTYAGLAESVCAAPAGTLPDGRTVCQIEPDVHAAAGMACIDCHVHTELMGDGVSRAHQEEQVEVRCESCHAPVGVRWSEVADPVSRRLGRARVEDDIVATATRGTPLWNVTFTAGAWRLTGKRDGRIHTIPVVAAEPADVDEHGGAGHDRLTCVACHAAVAPTCASCHTRYRAEGTQWDFGSGAEAPGQWVEVGGANTVAPPALGVGADGRIRPAIPGMIATIVPSPTQTLPVREVRRFALLDPHATRLPSRRCVDCHRSPGALGLGTGTLDPETLRFTPSRAAPGTPERAEDGWVPLLPVRPGEGTRIGSRSLNADEMHRILRVGVCLGCHAPVSTAVWSRIRASRPSACTLPDGWWDGG